MLDAHQLNVFVTAAKTLNFTAAARQLHMTQPSVSQHIQTLENGFDMPLFIRSGRHLALTAAGQTLLPMAQEMVSLSHHIEETMESLKGEVFGHLMVGCSTTVGKYVLPFLLAEFMRQNPKVEASCLVTSRPLAIDMLCEGEVQLALSSGTDFYRDVECHKLLTDAVNLIVPLGHPWATCDYIQPDDLFSVDFIVREKGSGTRTVADAGLQPFGLSTDDLRTVLTLGNTEAIAFAVQEGIGVGFVSQIVASRLVKGRVAVVPVRGLTLTQDIYICRSNTRPATRAQAAFWEFLIDPHNDVLCQLQAAEDISNEWPSFPNLSILNNSSLASS